MFAVERGIPMPARRNMTKYPFAQLEVGDSFAVPIPMGTDAGARTAAILSAAYSWGKRNSIRFAVRLDDNKATARVWRVA